MSTRTTWRWLRLVMATVLALTLLVVNPIHKPVFSDTPSADPLYGGPVQVTDAPAELPSKPVKEESQNVRVIVRLQDPPLARYEGGIPGLKATSPQSTGAARLDLSTPESQAYLEHLTLVQEQFVHNLVNAIPEARPQRQYRIVLNGFAVQIPRIKLNWSGTCPA